MAVGRKYRAYREALAKLGLEQLDVYRFKDHDELRLRTQDGRIVVVKLPRKREEMKVEEFIKHVEAAVKG